jgi:hypothetical protein
MERLCGHGGLPYVAELRLVGSVIEMSPGLAFNTGRTATDRK